MASQSCQNIRIEPFTERYADDVNTFFRREMFSFPAILMEVYCNTFSYLFTLVVAILTYSFVFDKLLVSVAIAIAVTALISVFIIIQFLNSVDYDGHHYPRKLNNSPMGVFLIAVDTSKQPVKLVGTIGIEPLTDGALLTRYGVKREYRRLGLGKRLLTTAVDHCQERGMKRLLLTSWHVYSLYDVKKSLTKAGFVEKQLILWPTYFPVFRYWYMEKYLM